MIEAAGPAGRLRAAPGLMRRLRTLACLNAPREICGLLYLVDEAGGACVLKARCLPNRSRDPVLGFRMRREEIDRVVRDWRGDTRPFLLGYFHSHGFGGPRPSKHDLATVRRLGGWHMILTAGAAVAYRADGARLITQPID